MRPNNDDDGDDCPDNPKCDSRLRPPRLPHCTSIFSLLPLHLFHNASTHYPHHRVLGPWWPWSEPALSSAVTWAYAIPHSGFSVLPPNAVTQSLTVHVCSGFCHTMCFRFGQQVIEALAQCMLWGLPPDGLMLCLCVNRKIAGDMRIC